MLSETGLTIIWVVPGVILTEIIYFTVILTNKAEKKSEIWDWEELFSLKFASALVAFMFSCLATLCIWLFQEENWVGLLTMGAVLLIPLFIGVNIWIGQSIDKRNVAKLAKNKRRKRK